MSMLEEIMKELENSSGPLTTRELARRLGTEEGALKGMLEFLERKGKLSVYRPDKECSECGGLTCVTCVFRASCSGGDEGGAS